MSEWWFSSIFHPYKHHYIKTLHGTVVQALMGSSLSTSRLIGWQKKLFILSNISTTFLVISLYSRCTNRWNWWKNPKNTRRMDWKQCWKSCFMQHHTSNYNNHVAYSLNSPFSRTHNSHTAIGGLNSIERSHFFPRRISEHLLQWIVFAKSMETLTHSLSVIESWKGRFAGSLAFAMITWPSSHKNTEPI